ISMSFARAASLYDAPFPSDDLRREDGTIDLSKVPNPNQVDLIDQALKLLGSAHGFSLAGAIFFRAGAPLDPATLPDLNGSVSSNASVFLVGVDATQPDYRMRRPIDVAFLPDGGPFGDRDLLALLPLQGVPLRPRARYAAVVTEDVRALDHRRLSRSPEMKTLAAGGRPAGLSDEVFGEYRDALAALAPLVAANEVAALAVFTTDDPTAALDLVRADALAHHPISPPKSPPALGDIFPDYCVYSTTVDVPDYQTGTPPYTKSGGGWSFDASGAPIFDHTETARLVFTVPRAPTPPGGWPTVVFVRTGGGGDRPLVDRGPCATAEFTQPITPGTGPAMDFAKVGFAGVEIDGPLGGLRNTTGGNEDFLIFNVLNAAALRDNVRESALELTLLADALPSTTFDAHDCPGGGTQPAAFDGAHLALMGHSMGAWIAPLALAAQPRFGAAVLSGAGGSYIANVMDKIKPVQIRPLAEALLDFDMDNRSLDAHDPALTLIEWAAEPSDPQVYARRIVREPAQGEAPRDVLMLQGIVDHYILPSIANATSLSLGLDQAGPAYDADNPEERMLAQPALGPLLPLAGARAIALPASGNLTAPGGSPVTAVVVQHPGDAIEDGHEVVFQTDPPKHQYRCFLSSFARGLPSVPPDGAADDPCP
ncbi:MAG TPA: hypothetical protein VII38_10005, partial [Polyangia bacterium]